MALIPPKLKRKLSALPPMFTSTVAVLLGLLFFVFLLWIVLAMLDSDGYLRLVRSGFLLIGLVAVIFGVMRAMPLLIKIGLVLLVLGFITTIDFSDAVSLTTELGKNTAEQMFPGKTRMEDPHEAIPRLMTEDIPSSNQSDHKALGLLDSVRYGFTRRDILWGSYSLVDYMLTLLILANAIWYHKKRWPLERFVSANIAMLGFFVVSAFVLGGM